MDVYLLYAYVGIICAIVIAIILNRVRSTSFKETIDGTFCSALTFFIFFCIVDSAWGVIGSPTYFANRVAYIVSTYGFHIMAAFASFVCSGYVVCNLKLRPQTKRIFRFIRLALITAQVLIIIQNLFTGLFFTIDEEAVYNAGRLRVVSFLLQFCHYIPIIFYSFFRLSKGKNDSERSYLYSSSLIFSGLPLIFGILQMLYPDGPFYSLGFLVTAVTMYAFNVTAQREAYLAVYSAAKEYEKSKSKSRKHLNVRKMQMPQKRFFLRICRTI